MTKDVQDACRILRKAYQDVLKDSPSMSFEHYDASRRLHHALQHLAYPDRDVYPKTRRATKGAPIVRR